MSRNSRGSDSDNSSAANAMEPGSYLTWDDAAATLVIPWETEEEPLYVPPRDAVTAVEFRVLVADGDWLGEGGRVFINGSLPEIERLALEPHPLQPNIHVAIVQLPIGPTVEHAAGLFSFKASIEDDGDVVREGQSEVKPKHMAPRFYHSFRWAAHHRSPVPSHLTLTAPWH